VLFGVVYTPREQAGPARTGLELFTSWRPPLAFKGHWRFAAGGGMGLVEARTAGELSRCIAPFAPFFDFTVAQLEAGQDAPAPEEPVAPPAPPEVLSIA